ncbi:hypothetical protein SDC9_148259 [bioreactor metagenome]|uniref:Uncharacterized protein n=1 Tax=bioreactor metagenome TaxID=1076179 RepID=A0A645EIT9_9ZZZZ
MKSLRLERFLTQRERDAYRGGSLRCQVAAVIDEAVAAVALRDLAGGTPEKFHDAAAQGLTHRRAPSVRGPVSARRGRAGR